MTLLETIAVEEAMSNPVGIREEALCATIKNMQAKLYEFINSEKIFDDQIGELEDKLNDSRGESDRFFEELKVARDKIDELTKQFAQREAEAKDA